MARHHLIATAATIFASLTSANAFTVVADPRYEEYTFLNGLGRLVQRARINDRPTHVDLSAEPGGVYLLTLVGAGQVDRSRLIREWLLYEGAGARMPIAEDPCSDTT